VLRVLPEVAQLNHNVGLVLRLLFLISISGRVLLLVVRFISWAFKHFFPTSPE